MKKVKDIDLDRMRELLSYKDGHLFWRISGRSRRMGVPIGSLNSEGYLSVQIDGIKYLSHRIIWVLHKGHIPKGIRIDHKDRDKSNNRIDNLRMATHSQNCANGKKRGSSGLPKGVYRYLKTNRYVAQIRHNNKLHHLGHFDCSKQAHAAYMAAAKKYHGEFSRSC